MTEQEKINGWTFEETVKTAENLMENEQNMFKWDVLRHLRDFVETYKEELEQYRALGLSPELIEAMQGHNIAMINDLAEYQALGTVEEILKVLDNHNKVVAMQHETLKEYRNLGTVEELRAKNEKLQGYRNQMSIYAEQHKIILASDVLDMLEELE